MLTNNRQFVTTIKSVITGIAVTFMLMTTNAQVIIVPGRSSPDRAVSKSRPKLKKRAVKLPLQSDKKPLPINSNIAEKMQSLNFIVVVPGLERDDSVMTRAIP